MLKSVRVGCAWMVHIFTALGAFLGLLALAAIYKHHYIIALWYMGAAFVVDNLDGTLARYFRVSEYAAHIDGALLDNIIDFFTYSMIPAVFILASNLIAEPYRILGAALICFASCYQFTQRNAKTKDHFFLGFPSYWNLVIFYAYCWHLPQIVTLGVIIICFIASFVPIKYVYPSRMEYLSKQRSNILLMLMATLLCSACAIAILATYPEQNSFLNYYTGAYMILYFLLSLYRTFWPLI
ncbi:MAG: phosphatidylcholine synthase [Coxiella sp. (in: Bacteria)]|nr:MAG: phosphatidylcholine synthase [Coxiella sp. (in: g-proteobacteria)]